MPAFPPEHLARWTGGRWTTTPAAPLAGFAIDTRRLRPGEVFVALRTEKRDGHDFIAAARAAGAAAAVVERPSADAGLPELVVPDALRAFQVIAREHRRGFDGRVAGITGSAGKTSTKDLLALLLGPDTLATEGNLNNHLGVPLTLTRLDPARHRFAVVEAGISEPGEMDPLAEMIEPDVALVTLVGPAHTDALGGLDGVAREKAVLPAAVRPSGVALFPRATADFAAFRALDVRRIVIERADVMRPAEPPNDTVYFTVTHRADETAIAIAYGPPPPLVFTLRRVSDGMAQNAVLAVCAALWLGVSAAEVRERIRQWAAPALRGEIRRTADQMLYLDCYNANPASMGDALAAFGEIAPPGRPRLYVLGGMEELGAVSAEHHRNLGRQLALRPEDHVCVIGAEAGDVRAGALEAGARRDQVEVVTSLAPVAARLAPFRGAVFVKGSRKYRLETLFEPAVGAAGSVQVERPMLIGESC